MGPRGFRMGRRRGLVAGALIGSAVARNSAKNQEQNEMVDEQQAQAAAPIAPAEDKYTQLEKLAQLKEQGILTDEEFQAQKAIILAQ